MSTNLMNIRPPCKSFILAVILLPLSCLAEWVQVSRVIDGDTFVTSDGTIVRVKEIDTPETKHPTKQKETGGEAATQLATFFLKGNFVWLDGSSKDKYGRRLARVQLPGGQSYADVVRSHGYDKNSKSIFAYRALAEAPQKLAKNPYLLPASDFSWVDGYIRSDGIYVPGHFRKKSEKKSDASVSSSAISKSTSWKYDGYSTSSSGSTYVNGYYRKDGTYVKPHYRKSK